MKIDVFVQKSIILAINSSYERVIRKINSDLKEYGCNFLQSLILISIFMEEESIVTPSVLASTLKTSKSNVSHAISALEKNEYTKRRTSETDSRIWEITLTHSGRQIVSKLMKIIDKYENSYEQILGKEESSTFTENFNTLFKTTETLARLR